MSSKEFRNKSTRLHGPHQSLSKEFRENGVKQAGIMSAQGRKPPQHLQKDPKKVLKQRFYEDWLKGLDNDKH